MPTTFVVEHLDPDMGPWSTAEYKCIAQESQAAGVNFCLASVPDLSTVPPELQGAPGLTIDARKVDDLFADTFDKVCLLDPAATTELSPADGDLFTVFLFGGILGDDPPRDRTSELRKRGFATRRLGPKQMTTDTAVRVTRFIVLDKVPLDQIPYIDEPELRFNQHESTQMPFRYVRDDDGNPIMPDGMGEMIRLDADKGLEDLL